MHAQRHARRGKSARALNLELKEKGVEFKVCNNTLVSRKIEKSKVIPEADIVPSGVAEVGKLQQKYGFVYLKP